MMDGVVSILHDLVVYLGVLFTVLFVVTMYAAYEFNRRLHLISRVTHPQTHRLFRGFRLLFLFLSLYFSTHMIYTLSNTNGSSAIICLILAIVRLASYIGIIATSMSLALSPILTIGRICDNKDEYFPLYVGAVKEA